MSDALRAAALRAVAAIRLLRTTGLGQPGESFMPTGSVSGRALRGLLPFVKTFAKAFSRQLINHRSVSS